MQTLYQELTFAKIHHTTRNREGDEKCHRCGEQYSLHLLPLKV